MTFALALTIVKIAVLAYGCLVMYYIFKDGHDNNRR